jgi:hypothetical protein
LKSISVFFFFLSCITIVCFYRINVRIYRKPMLLAVMTTDINLQATFALITDPRMRNSGLSSTGSCFNFPYLYKLWQQKFIHFMADAMKIRKPTKEKGNRKISCSKWRHKERRSGEISSQKLPDNLKTRINLYCAR